MILISALWLFPTGKMTVVILLIIYNYRGLMYETIGFFSQLKEYYVQGNFKAERILEILECAQTDKAGGMSLPSMKGEVKAENLSFSYEKQEILHDVSFLLAPHTATALLGASGSGKSTLLALLTRLYQPQHGRICVDGQNLFALDELSIASCMSVVNQEPFFFAGTIRENLCLVKPDADERQLVSACQRAHIYDEIMSLTDGFDTVLDENATNLSGGQKQRLAVARALIKDAPILLLDEPTSALDPDNRRRMLHTLRELKRDKTLLVIAHQLEDLRLFDQVLCMENGRLRKAGEGVEV